MSKRCYKYDNKTQIFKKKILSARTRARARARACVCVCVISNICSNTNSL